ncbi:MAG: two-component regulator propeller domain-containing protein [Chitinispirillia bacterium]
MYIIIKKSVLYENYTKFILKSGLLYSVYFFLIFFLGCSKNQQWTLYNTKNTALSSDLIRQIIIKDDSLQWIGTYGGGLFRKKNNTWEKVSLPFGGKYILTLIPDLYGGLWIGTARKGAYYFLKNRWKHLNSDSGLTDNNVWHILEDSKRNLWFCSRYKGICRMTSDSMSCFTMKNGLPDRQVTLAVEDSKGGIWFGTVRGGLCRYINGTFEYLNTKHGIRGNYIRALICDSIPRWVGTWDRGLNYFTGDRWVLIEEVKKPVVYIGFDKREYLWIGTWGHGVYVKRNDKWDHITSSNSKLPNNFVIDIAFDSRGTAYFATSKGIARFEGY